jgi:hypothetical protein
MNLEGDGLPMTGDKSVQNLFAHSIILTSSASSSAYEDD